MHHVLSYWDARIVALWIISIKFNIKSPEINTITSTVSLQNNILPLAL